MQGVEASNRVVYDVTRKPPVTSRVGVEGGIGFSGHSQSEGRIWL